MYEGKTFDAYPIGKRTFGVWLDPVHVCFFHDEFKDLRKQLAMIEKTDNVQVKMDSIEVHTQEDDAVVLYLIERGVAIEFSDKKFWRFKNEILGFNPQVMLCKSET